MELTDTSEQLPDAEALEEFARHNLRGIETVAAMLAVTPRTILRYQSELRDPLPVAIRGGKGKPNFYFHREVLAGAVRRAARARGHRIP